ncbi:zinc finger HIT domain-containing protein 2 [Ambystoma mexicanum]|uniref:zinc finger HIT domain-containing protein 2 n=1 Tax=Ambystoma mexicanum TaxID=8296 RepID=UPI0037E773FC
MDDTVDVRVPTSSGSSFMTGESQCGLCLTAPSRYTCPRCNVSYCALSCYRGVRHQGCSESFYRDEVLRGLQETNGTEGLKGDIVEILKRVRDTQLREEEGLDLEGELREEESQEEGAEGQCLGDGDARGDVEKLDPQALWQRLTLSEQQDFQRLLKSGDIGTLLIPWQPWWENHDRPLLVQEVGAGLSAPLRKEQSFIDEDISGSHETLSLQEHSAVPPTSNHSPVPPVPKDVPLLSTLTRKPSPLVKFNLVNALYAYAFGMKLYNGDVGEDFLLQEFCDTSLVVSAALSSTSVFGSTAEALLAGIQAVLVRGSNGDPQGAALAVAHILMGRSNDRRKDYTLAALSHFAGMLARARRLAPKEEKQAIFNAKKKCEFLLSWANENEDSLTILSVEVQSEYTNYAASLKEMELVTRRLEKSWGGSKPPEKKVLIKELD